MRILHVVQGYFPAIGGVERLIQKVSEQLVARYQDEVTVYTTTAYNCELFCRRDQPELPSGTEKINGVTIRRFPVFNRFNRMRRLLAGGAYYLRLPYNDWIRTWYNGPIVLGMAEAIAWSGAQVVGASSFPLLHMYYALQGAKKAKVPIIFNGGIHTADSFGFDRPMIYRAIQEADGYIANSTFERSFLIERGIPSEKISVIGAGVDLKPFEGANGKDIRHRFGWGDRPVIAFVGQQVPHKGVGLVLEAMKKIWNDLPDTCLLIAGAKTTYSRIINQLIEGFSPNQKKQIAIINNFSEEEKAKIFASCDVLAFPSRYESFGIVFLEAWAVEKPVVGVRAGAVPSIVDHGRDGFLIEPGNSTELAEVLTLLLKNPGLRRTMGIAGYEKVRRHYTWDIIARKFREIYIKARDN